MDFPFNSLNIQLLNFIILILLLHVFVSFFYFFVVHVDSANFFIHFLNIWLDIAHHRFGTAFYKSLKMLIFDRKVLNVRVRISFFILSQLFEDDFGYLFIAFRIDNKLFFVLEKFEIWESFVESPIKNSRFLHWNKSFLGNDWSTTVDIFSEHLMNNLYHVICVGFCSVLFGNNKPFIKILCIKHSTFKQFNPGDVWVKHFVRYSFGPFLHQI